MGGGRVSVGGWVVVLQVKFSPFESLHSFSLEALSLSEREREEEEEGGEGEEFNPFWSDCLARHTRGRRARARTRTHARTHARISRTRTSCPESTCPTRISRSSQTTAPSATARLPTVCLCLYLLARYVQVLERETLRVFVFLLVCMPACNRTVDRNRDRGGGGAETISVP